MTVLLSPFFGGGYQAFNNSGEPLAGGYIYTYLAGTTTPATTYTTVSGTVANANPIVLDSGGRPPQEIWLLESVAYKFVFTDSVGNPVGYTADYVTGINGTGYATSVYATMYADVFTGNGTQTNWTLTASPVSINNINVSINGVVQVPGVDYTVSGTTLTTTSAVLLSAVMLVKYAQAIGPPNFADAVFSIYDLVDASKIATFEAAGLTTATTRTYTFPDASGTLALLSGTQTFAGDTTFTNQLSIQGLTFGKGNGALSLNTAAGYLALNAATTGNGNTGFGYNAIQNNLTGTGNVGFGYAANRTNTAGSYNTAIGTSALQNGTGDKNVGIGNNSGNGLTTGSKNVIIGSYTGTFAPISQTGNNFIVLSDGDANVRAYWNGFDATFNGALRVTDPIGTNAAAPTIASGTVITPSKAITFVSGTTAVATIVPTFFAGAGGSIVLIPTGAFTWTTAGNIALAGTAVVNKALTMTYDGATLKWYPSYIA